MDRELTTVRLLLRAPRPGDAAFAFERWATDARVHRHLGWLAHDTVEQTRRQLDWDQACWVKRSAWTWMLVPHGERGPVGMVRLLPQRAGGASHHLQLGYLLAPAWQGRGLMREAVGALVAHALAQPGIWRIDALCDVEHPASTRVLEAAGLRREGRLARVLHQPALGEAPRDAWLHAATRAEPGAALALSSPA